MLKLPKQTLGSFFYPFFPWFVSAQTTGKKNRNILPAIPPCNGNTQSASNDAEKQK
jgi:hypothetical protein